jgi:hypothetical protein
MYVRMYVLRMYHTYVCVYVCVCLVEGVIYTNVCVYVCMRMPGRRCDLTRVPFMNVCITFVAYVCMCVCVYVYAWSKV